MKKNQDKKCDYLVVKNVKMTFFSIEIYIGIYQDLCIGFPNKLNARILNMLIVIILSHK